MQNNKQIIDKKNYLVVKKVISEDWCQLISEYANLKAQIKPNVYRSGDSLKQVHREYADPLMEVLLQRFTPLVEEATGCALWPTLSFYYSYKNGQQLLPHKDRSSCQIVAGLCIGADEQYKQTQGTWPLWFKFEDQSEAVSVEYGDLVIFKGHETEHWREPFTGQWFISAIFGFVEKEGPYAFQRFDQRSQLGKPHVGMFRWSFGCLKNKMKRWIK